MILPTKAAIAVKKNPSLLLIFSRPKTGKTSMLCKLENNLIIDLEDGADFYDGMYLKAKNVDDLREIMKAINDAGKPYKRITIDTVSKLEEMVLPLAADLYRETPMGRNYVGSDIRTLPNGAGYLYTRTAFFKIIDAFKGLCETLILVGHVKDSVIEKNGEEQLLTEIDLTGKTKSIVSARADAIGWLKRSDENEGENILSFKGNGSIISGSRIARFSNKEIVISEMDGDDLITHWDDIFLDENE